MTGVSVQTGGPIRGPQRYLERPADRELLEALRGGALCALFAPRQEGKTSLMLRTTRTLMEDGVRCSMVDLGFVSPGSASTSSEDLFEYLITQIASDLREHDEAERSTHGFVRWLTAVAARSPTQIAICIDEVHQLIEAPVLAEELLQALRLLHEGRARSPGLGRVSYCIAGVARPRDLVRDRSRDPFDHGTVIRLEDFSLDQLAPLRADLASIGIAEEAIDEIYDWTAGHPFMTAKLVRKLASRGNTTRSIKREAEDIVQQMLADSDTNESYLSEARLLFEATPRFGDADLGNAIEIYRRLLRGQPTHETDAGDSAAILVLAGIAAARDHRGVRMLEVRNRIIQHVFDEVWLDRMEVERQLGRPVRRWLSLEKATSALLTGDELASALAVAKRASDVNQEQRALLLISLEADVNHKLAEAETAQRHEAELERQRAMRMVYIAIAWLVIAFISMGVMVYLWRVTSVESKAKIRGLEADVRDANERASHAERSTGSASNLNEDLATAQAQLHLVMDDRNRMQERLLQSEKECATKQAEMQGELSTARQSATAARRELSHTLRELARVKWPDDIGSKR